MVETIVVVGEALMDCARSVSGGEVSEIPGGSPMNVAIGLGRLGYRVVLAARVGSDDFGQRMVEHIRASHVNLIPAATGLGKTSRATALLAADGSASYEFDLEWDLTPDMVEPGEYLHVHTGSIGATLAPGAQAVRAILERERRAGATISYDPNARPRIMGEADDVRQQMEALIALSDIVKASDEDIEWLYPHWSTDDVVAHWKALGVVLVVITGGTSGATAWGAGAPVSLPTQARTVVDTIGAGDTVMSGLISALADSGRLGSGGRQKLAELTGDELAGVLNFALAAAAITVSRAGANPPTRAEMDKVVYPVSASVNVDQAFLRGWVRAPQAEDHKYSRGVLTLVTGSSLYPGAALIGVEAALRTGVGMLRYVGPAGVAQMVVMQHPEVVIAPANSDAAVVGSGMVAPLEGELEAEVLAVAAQSIPSVIDAGALGYAENFGPLSVLTPHQGELHELCERLGVARGTTDLESAQALATQLSMAVVVKGSLGAVVNQQGDVWRLPRATPWLATAGTGDALAGIIGAVCASWHERLHESPGLIAEAAAAGALIHSIAAARASARAVGDADSPTGGPFSVMDVCREIPAVIGETLSSRA